MGHCRELTGRRALTVRGGAVALLLLALGGCQTAYYEAMEKFGVEKRDILVSRVDNARDAQQDAKEQFESALEHFIAVTNYDGGDLEKQYRILKREYDTSMARAEEVESRISDVRHVASRLFQEWNDELGLYSDQSLRRSSEQQLRRTQVSYERLITAMEQAGDKIPPVLDAFQDRVLFLKHNLNASAIASLREQKQQVEGDISVLIADMNRSIAAADEFIEAMSQSQ